MMHRVWPDKFLLPRRRVEGARPPGDGREAAGHGRCFVRCSWCSWEVAIVKEEGPVRSQYVGVWI